LRSPDSGLEPKEVADIHNDIYQSALRLHRTLRNYLLALDFHSPKPEEEGPLLSPDMVRANILAGVKQSLRLNQREADVTTSIADCSIRVKPDDLSRLAEEIIDNACKFSRQGTPIKLELSDAGALTVTDEGRGLSADEIKQIGAFNQFDRKKHEQQVLGLGLVLVQKIASECKAEFSITSELGKGTQVRIAFPPASAA
jgi:two-component system sensor histidine kinase/response regulator